MKKLSLIIAFIIAIGNIGFAQKSKKGAAMDIDVPTPVLKTFNSKYKMAKKIAWSQEEDNYRADFKYNDYTMAASYSPDGKLLYTEKELSKAQHNKAAVKYIQENYAGYKTTSMRKRDTYDKKTTFIAMLKKTKEVLEVEFDKKGGFIRDTDKTPVSASRKKGKKAEDEETMDDEEEKPAKKASVKEKSKKSTDDEETDEEATPAPKKETKAKTAPKKTEDDDEEEAKPAPKKEKAKPAKKEKKKKTEDEDDDE